MLEITDVQDIQESTSYNQYLTPWIVVRLNI